MKTIFKKILSRKDVRYSLYLLIAILALSGYFTISGVIKNVTMMSSPDDEAAEPYFPPYPPVNTQGKDPSLIQRGEYLAKAGDCIACHTNSPQKGPQFAGGLPMQTPFGTIYSPNITPDKETGIGGWTEEQFIKAMREGISPHGSYYYPAFPYLYFNKVSTDDLKAIKAYLDSIPPVKLQNRENDMVWPFNQRLLQLPWRILFFHPEEPDVSLGKTSSQDERIKRGAYLVEGLGHCAMCHSPSYHVFSEKLSLGAPERKYDFKGAKIQGYLAPDISKTNLGNVPVQEIIDVFLKDKMIGGGNIEGPMLEVNHNSLRHLTRSDLEAIALYLKNVQTETPPKPKVVPGQEGKGTYDTYCSGCHAAGAGGAPKLGDAMSWAPILKQTMPKVYENAIKGIGGMPAKGTCLSCTDDDIKKAVDYMTSSVSGAELANMTPPAKPLTMADGKRIYDQNCAVCHNSGYKNAPKPGDASAWSKSVKAGFVETYLNVVTGRNGHPPMGACPDCSTEEMKIAIKYMMNQSGAQKDYNLW